MRGPYANTLPRLGNCGTTREAPCGRRAPSADLGNLWEVLSKSTCFLRAKRSYLFIRGEGRASNSQYSFLCILCTTLSVQENIRDPNGITCLSWTINVGNNSLVSPSLKNQLAHNSFIASSSCQLCIISPASYSDERRPAERTVILQKRSFVHRFPWLPLPHLSLTPSFIRSLFPLSLFFFFIRDDFLFDRLSSFSIL